MKSKLKTIISNLNPGIFGSETINIDLFKKLGVGEGNINYLFSVNGKKYLCRVNISNSRINISKNEYENLRKVSNIGISPKPLFYFKKNNSFNRNFIILEFIEGKALKAGQRTFSNRQIKELARTLATLHSQKIKLQSKNKQGYDAVLEYTKEFTKKLNKYSKGKNKEWLKSLMNDINHIMPIKDDSKYTLIHGDVCPQNTVETKGGIKLIDWESLTNSDPARDIANVLVDFGLKGKQLEAFLKEYHRIREDHKLLQRARIHEIIMRTNYFLWELVRTFEILNNEMPKEYLQKTTSKIHFKEAKKQFKELSKLIELNNIGLETFFGNKDLKKIL